MGIREMLDRWVKRCSEAPAQAPRLEDRRGYERIKPAEGDDLVVSFVVDDRGQPLSDARLGQSAFGKRVRASVDNISYRGLAARFWDPQVTGAFKQDVNCGFYLEIEDYSVEARCRVAWLGIGVIGVQFLDLSEEARGILADYLRPRFIGTSLAEITGESLHLDGPEHELRWFQGENNTHIFSWHTKDGDVVRQQFVFVDYVVDWEQGRPLRTGEIHDDRLARHWSGYARPADDVVVFYDVPSQEILALAEAILGASQIDPRVMAPLFQKLSETGRGLGPRKNLPAEAGVRLRLIDERLGETHELAVTDLGLGGLRASLPAGDRTSFPHGHNDKVAARVVLGGEELAIPVVRLVRVSEETVSVEFVQLTPQAAQRVREYLERASQASAGAIEPPPPQE